MVEGIDGMKERGFNGDYIQRDAGSGLYAKTKCIPRIQYTTASKFAGRRIINHQCLRLVSCLLNKYAGPQ